MTELKRLFVYALFSLFYTLFSGKHAEALDVGAASNDKWTSPSGRCGQCYPDEPPDSDY